MMPEIDVEIDQDAVALLRDLVKTIRASLQGELVVELDNVEDDEDLMDAWQQGLVEALKIDCRELIRVIEDNSFGSSAVRLSEEEALSIIRAASAIRIRIKETLLSKIDDEQLELGEFDMDNLAPEKQKAYGVYLFLASLQELLIDQLDPEACNVPNQ